MLIPKGNLEWERDFSQDTNGEDRSIRESCFTSSNLSSVQIVGIQEYKPKCHNLTPLDLTLVFRIS